MGKLFPVFEYSLAGKDDRLCSEDKLWNTLLCNTDLNLSIEEVSFTIGDYFLSAKKFLEENSFYFLKKGLESIFFRSFEAVEIKKILICLEKHGPFYHPIKVTAILKDEASACFVLNGAVSDMGLAIIENEYNHLKKFSKKAFKPDGLSSEVFVPEVFGMGFVKSEKGEVGFFLAQWFENFQEFHVVMSGNKKKIGLLNSDGSFSIISESELIEMFRRISEILTFYYDIPSSQQIFPWHHAAGDFIVKIDDQGIDVKLITVRGYGALIESDFDNFLVGLFFFFLNLSLRMRIDRNKGTEEYVFLDKKVVKASVEGFIIGLKKNLEMIQGTENISHDFFNIFVDFIKEFKLENILNAFIMITGSYDKDAPETSIIRKNLETHAKTVFEVIKEI